MAEQIFSATKKSKVFFSAYIWIRPVVNGNETLPERQSVWQKTLS